MITFGGDYGGPEHRDSEIRSKLSRASSIATNIRDPKYDNGTESWINPIYIVPGSIHDPEFVGYKLGKFSKKRKGLVVMIFVPKTVANGEGVPEFISEAVRLAAEKFSSKGMSFSTLKAEKIIQAIENGLRSYD